MLTLVTIFYGYLIMLAAGNGETWYVRKVFHKAYGAYEYSWTKNWQHAEHFSQETAQQHLPRAAAQADRPH